MHKQFNMIHICLIKPNDYYFYCCVVTESSLWPIDFHIPSQFPAHNGFCFSNHIFSNHIISCLCSCNHGCVLETTLFVCGWAYCGHISLLIFLLANSKHTGCNILFMRFIKWNAWPLLKLKPFIVSVFPLYVSSSTENIIVCIMLNAIVYCYCYQWKKLKQKWKRKQLKLHVLIINN